MRYSDNCQKAWGTFQADQQDVDIPHPLAPPSQLQGVWDPRKGRSVETSFSQPLLQTLTEASHCEEATLWEAITECIEPLEVLRSTVKRWKDLATDDSTQETADNFLLLLDTELLGDTPAQSKPAQPCPSDCVPEWAPLPQKRYLTGGRGASIPLLPPPSVRMLPDGPTSITLRQATAYADWLEQACACIARCLVQGQDTPTGISCPGLAGGLGPAVHWLRALGAVFHDYGLTLASDVPSHPF